MTGEHMHTTSKERMVSEIMFSTEHAPKLKSEVAYTLHFQLCSARFTALQMKNSRRTASAINPATTENTDNSHLQM